MRVGRANLPEIFLGALLAVAIFAMGMLFGSSGHQPSQAKSDQYSAQMGAQKQSHAQPKPFTQAWYLHDATGFFTIMLVGVVGIQAGLLIWQLFLINRTMRDQAEATRAARRSAEAARDQLTIAHPPKLRIAAVQVWVKDGKGKPYGTENVEPRELTKGIVVEGYASVMNDGSENIKIVLSDCFFFW